MRTILTFLACLTLAPLVTGCSRSSEYCNAKRDCEGSSDRQYDECVIDYDALGDTADAYGCGDLFVTAHECTMLHNDCNVPVLGTKVFRPGSDCSNEIADWLDCIKGHSSLD